jgi:hypothetical protein
MATFDLRDKSAITVIQGELPKDYLYPGKVFLAESVPVAYECKERCGVCCKHFYIGLRKEDAADADFRQAMEMRNIPVVSMFGGVAVIKAPCENLMYDAEGKACCAIYDKRPHYCRSYDCHDDPIMEIVKAVKRNPDMLK